MASNSQQPNFTLDVNRTKTQRWVDAKKASYGGDDWGGYDDYGDYEDDEEEEEPPPPPKQTGLRQRGQASISAPGYPSAAASAPAKPQAPPLQRMESFGAGDDRRGMPPGIGRPPIARESSGGAQPRQPTVSADPPPRQSSYDQRGFAGMPQPQGHPAQQRRPSPQNDAYRPADVRNPMQVPPVQTNLPGGTRPSENPSPGQARYYSRTTPATSTTPSSGGDIYYRRDFSPSAVPQPLSTRSTPSQESQPPVRKESLNSSKRPSLATPRQDSLHGEHNEGSRSVSTQEEQQEDEQVPSAETQLPPPIFVRPSDIYRRMTEEKERERQSMESGRPSMDIIDRAAGSTSRTGQPLRTSQDSARDSDAIARPKPTLDPVTERKSEYGMDGFMVSDPALARAIGAQVHTDTLSTPPSLPQLGRFSGFGMDLGFGAGDGTLGQDKSTGKPHADTTPTHVSDARNQSLPEPERGTSPTESSLGFHSAVNQAFDGHNERETLSPTSNYGSQRSKDGSDVSRSNTDSTGGISPIMSRVPSAKTATARAQERHDRFVAVPSITEEEQGTGSPSSRPTSSGNLKGMMPPTAPASAAGHSRNTSGDSSTTPAMSQYTREYRTPSPGNVLAKVPAISTRKHIEHSNQGEIAMTTPLETQTPYSRDGTFAEPVDHGSRNIQPTDFSRRESDLAKAANSPSLSRDPELGVAEDNAQTSFMRTHASGQPLPDISTRDLNLEGPGARPVSPPKSRVREIATKFNTLHDRPSPTGSVSSWASSPRRSASPDKGDSAVFPSRSPRTQSQDVNRGTFRNNEEDDMADLAPPPRPRLPGEWVSYAGSVASTAPSVAPSGSDNYESAGSRPESRLATLRVARETSQDPPDFSPTTAKRPLAGKTHDPTDEGPMAALAAAGSALAENFKQTVGLGGDETSASEADESDSVETPGFQARPASNTTPKALPQRIFPTSSASTVPPTPPLKEESIDHEGAPQRSSGYFPVIAPLHVANPEQSQAIGSEPSSNSVAYTPMSVLETPNVGGENDRLRRDIVQSLSPASASFSESATPRHSQAHATLENHNKIQPLGGSAISQEGGSNWARDVGGTGPTDRNSGASSSNAHSSLSFNRQEPLQGEGIQRTSKMESPTLGQGPVSRPGLLGNRFSWEESQDTSSSISTPANEQQRDSNSYVRDAPPPESDRAVPSMAATNEASASHEPGIDSSPQTPRLREERMDFDERSSPVELPTPTTQPLRDISPTLVELPASDVADQQRGGLRRPSETPNSSSSPVSQRVGSSVSAGQRLPSANVPGLKQILAMKQPTDRINAYKNARDQSGTADHGLNDWLTYMVQTHPEHAIVPAGVPRPIVNTTGLVGSVRDRVPPALSKLTKTRTGDVGQSPSAYTPDSGNAMSPDRSASTSQSKRQELLHNAGVFGGKASQGAKGLFAKSKSRFRGASTEKADTNTPSTPPAETRGMLSSFRRRSRYLDAEAPTPERSMDLERPSVDGFDSHSRALAPTVAEDAIHAPEPRSSNVQGARDLDVSYVDRALISAASSRDVTPTRSSLSGQRWTAIDQNSRGISSHALGSRTSSTADNRNIQESLSYYDSPVAGQHDFQNTSHYDSAIEDPFQAGPSSARGLRPRTTSLNYAPVQDEGLEDDDISVRRPRPWRHGQSSYNDSLAISRTNSSGASVSGVFGARGFEMWEDTMEEPSSTPRQSHIGPPSATEGLVNAEESLYRDPAEQQGRPHSRNPRIEVEPLALNRFSASAAPSTREPTTLALEAASHDRSLPSTNQYDRPEVPAPRKYSQTELMPRSRQNDDIASEGQTYLEPRAARDTALKRSSYAQHSDSYPSSLRSHSRNRSSTSFVSAMSTANEPPIPSQTDRATGSSVTDSTMEPPMPSRGPVQQQPVQRSAQPIQSLRRPEPAQMLPDMPVNPRQQSTEYNLPGVSPSTRSSKAKSWLSFRRRSQSPVPDTPSTRSRSTSIGDILAAVGSQPGRVNPRTSSQRPVSMDSSQLLNGAQAARPATQRTRNPSTDLLSQFSQNTAEVPHGSDSAQQGQGVRQASRSRSRFRNPLSRKSSGVDDIQRAATDPVVDGKPKKRRSSLIGSIFRRSNTANSDVEAPPVPDIKTNKLAKSNTRGSRPEALDPRGGNVSMGSADTRAKFDRVPRLPTLPNLGDADDFGNRGSLQMPQQYMSDDPRADDTHAWRPTRSRATSAASSNGIASGSVDKELPPVPRLPRKVEDPRRASQIAYLQRHNIFPARQSSVHSPAERDTAAMNRHSMYEYGSPSPISPDENTGAYFDIPQNKRYYASQNQVRSPAQIMPVTPQATRAEKSMPMPPRSRNVSTERRAASPAVPGTNPLRQHPTPNALPPPPPPRSPQRPLSIGAAPASAPAPAPARSSAPPQRSTTQSNAEQPPQRQVSAASSSVYSSNRLSTSLQDDQTPTSNSRRTSWRQSYPAPTKTPPPPPPPPTSSQEEDNQTPTPISTSRRTSWRQSYPAPTKTPPPPPTFSPPPPPLPSQLQHQKSYSRGMAANVPDSGIRARMAAREQEWEEMTAAVALQRAEAAARARTASPRGLSVVNGNGQGNGNGSGNGTGANNARNSRTFSLPAAGAVNTVSREQAAQYAAQLPPAFAGVSGAGPAAGAATGMGAPITGTRATTGTGASYNVRARAQSQNRSSSGPTPQPTSSPAPALARGQTQIQARTVAAMPLAEVLKRRSMGASMGGGGVATQSQPGMPVGGGGEDYMSRRRRTDDHRDENGADNGNVAMSPTAGPSDFSMPAL